MIKRLLITIDGRQYDVLVEVLDQASGVAQAPAQQQQVAAPAPVAVAAPPPPPAPAVPAPAPAVVAAPAAPTASASGPGDVPSPLSGRVIEILATPGKAVKEGDHVLTLEAMKMNTHVFASKTGTIKEVKVAVGDAVEENQVLITIA